MPIASMAVKIAKKVRGLMLAALKMRGLVELCPRLLKVRGLVELFPRLLKVNEKAALVF
eukprot:CAMPEP_0194345994 /NCGR_PEP_ID=MMETSP0171-20130528/105173_1 /TAXON_ID=218684 /ORGANISM="Corethron pennatum, Strain L29A3" /LENGTH=58 /DNA_ID=CAMNT_0039113057 /DNA_START=835 /DNA_END=1011 /DNA_ORIENTATION=-